ncbi:MAG TPA: TolC family protein [Symbiobacteriaceae bacterium]|nr:TolC family protein [Symbiobacteriaceae bacterium]
MAVKRPCLAAAALVAALLLAPAGALAGAPPAAEETAPVPTLTLADVLALAEAHNPGVKLAEYQVASARNTWTTAPAQAASLAPAAALYLQMQYGITLPQNTIAPADATRQAQINFEDAVVQYYRARQQVRLGALQAYVEWQKAIAMVAAQEGALTRAETQAAQVRTAFDAGAVAKFDLLQAETQVAGQKAALAGAKAMLSSVEAALEQVMGQPLPPGAQPAGTLPGSDEVTLDEDLGALTEKALRERPDLKQAKLQIASRRMFGANSGAAILQLQAAATQYEMSVLKAQTEVEQTLEACRGALAELKAREQALSPAREALRLAELRYEAGLGTYLEVQSAFANALQADAARIQAAANLAVQRAKLAQATGDL